MIFLRAVKNILCLLAFMICVAACSKDKADEDAGTILSSTSWRVAHYMDAGGDKTNDFLGLTIQFTATGTMVATRNGVSTNGTWSKNDNTNQLVFDMGPRTSGNMPQGALSNDWKITVLTSSEVSLYDEQQTSEMLVLTKN